MRRAQRIAPFLLVFCVLVSAFLLSSLSGNSAAFGFSTPSSSPTKVSSTGKFYEKDDGSSSSGERTIVEQQLGYLPSNFVRVSAWTTKTKVPIAIQTYPLQGGAKRRQAKATYGDSPTLQSPFPTLYWLTCPDIAKHVGDLERLGYLQDFEAQLHSDPELVERLWRSHRQYAKERWNALSEKDRILLTQTTEPALLRMRGIMEESGISGSNLTLATTASADGGDIDETVVFPSIKCLHAHYAHFRSTRDVPGCEQNPVGEMIHRRLLEDFPDLEL
jgi:hypothetical protein